MGKKEKEIRKKGLSSWHHHYRNPFVVHFFLEDATSTWCRNYSFSCLFFHSILFLCHVISHPFAIASTQLDRLLQFNYKAMFANHINMESYQHGFPCLEQVEEVKATHVEKSSG